jgi:hypothetical protein
MDLTHFSACTRVKGILLILSRSEVSSHSVIGLHLFLPTNFSTPSSAITSSALRPLTTLLSTSLPSTTKGLLSPIQRPSSDPVRDLWKPEFLRSRLRNQCLWWTEPIVLVAPVYALLERITVSSTSASEARTASFASASESVAFLPGGTTSLPSAMAVLDSLSFSLSVDGGPRCEVRLARLRFTVVRRR